MKNVILILLAAMILSSCGTSNRGVRSNDGLFYKGYKIKANGERKSKTFIFGYSACQRKNARMRKRHARMRNPERNVNYGITSSGNARQRR